MRYNIEVKTKIRSWKRGLVKSQKFSETIRVLEIETGKTMAYCPDLKTARLVLGAIEVFRSIAEGEIEPTLSSKKSVVQRLDEIVEDMLEDAPPTTPAKSFEQRLAEKAEERRKNNANQ